jgi:hypothetical protein
MIEMVNLGRWGQGEAVMDFVNILFWHISIKADENSIRVTVTLETNGCVIHEDV